jgi:large subunit ribosomal protein L17
MRHRCGNKKLNRPTDQRIALLRGLVRSLFLFNRIKTTDVRAKETKKYAERLITLAKEGSVHARRNALKMLPDKKVIKDLFSDIAPKYSNRSGGYTRLTKIGYRRGDASLMSIIELVE